MAYRLTRIYTRTGDAGETGLADGDRLSKDSPRIHLLGELDELNAHLGLLQSHELPTDLREVLIAIQHLLFDLGGDLSLPGRTSVHAEHINWLESWLDHFNASLPPLKEFILPGPPSAAAQCHVARTVCRRAERVAVTLARSHALGTHTLPFLNRLADVLFVAARIISQSSHAAETLWHADRALPVPPAH